MREGDQTMGFLPRIGRIFMNVVDDEAFFRPRNTRKSRNYDDETWWDALSTMGL